MTTNDFDYEVHLKEAKRIEEELKVSLGTVPLKRFAICFALFMAMALFERHYPSFANFLDKLNFIIFPMGLWYLAKLIGSESISVHPYMKRNGTVGYRVSSPFHSIDGPLYGGRF